MDASRGMPFVPPLVDVEGGTGLDGDTDIDANPVREPEPCTLCGPSF